MKLQMIILDARFICKKKKGENNDFNIKGLINIQNAMERGKVNTLSDKFTVFSIASFPVEKENNNW